MLLSARSPTQHLAQQFSQLALCCQCKIDSMSAFGIDWFGLVIPGRPILVNFEMVDPTKCAATIERPGDVAEISVSYTHLTLPTKA